VGAAAAAGLLTAAGVRRHGFPPGRQLVGVAHGLGRAGRRQPPVPKIGRGTNQCDPDQSVEVLLGRGTVEEHQCEIRVPLEELVEVVGHHAVWLNR
jgi:hypothetical protein